MYAFYHENEISAGQLVKLSENESWHLSKVLRLKVNETIKILNGKGSVGIGSIEHVTEKECLIKVESCEFIPLPHAKLHIGVGLTHSAERIEWLIEKLTELGTTSFTPLITQRTQRKQINIDRLKKISVAALKQSHQPWILKINEIQTLSQLFNNTFTFEKLLIATTTPTPERKEYTSLIKYADEVFLLIGPEGDFTEDEIKNAIRANFIPVRFCRQILRTETAAIYAAVSWLNAKLKNSCGEY